MSVTAARWLRRLCIAGVLQGLAEGIEFAGCRVEGVLGRGGMGIVYRATDMHLQRRVAIKLITAERAGEQEREEGPHTARGREAGAEPDVEDDAVHECEVWRGVGTRGALRCAVRGRDDRGRTAAQGAAGRARYRGSRAPAANRDS